MLFPENPQLMPGLWDAVATQLLQTEMCFVIKDGLGNLLAEAEDLSSGEAKLTLARLRQAQICRISANRGSAISPHFAGKRRGGMVLITELLTTPTEDMSTVNLEKLKGDLETAAINLLFTKSGVDTVLIPISMAPWVIKDAEISSVEEGLVFRKRN